MQIQTTSLLSTTNNKQSGFTLIEVLIAMVIFAIMATLAYGGLSSVISTSTAVQGQIKRLEALQRTVMFFERDVRQLVARPMNTEVAKKRSAVELNPSGTPFIEFTRAGNPNPSGLVRSSLQRVVYVFEKEVLTRRAWGQVDHLQNDEPVIMELMKQLKSVEFRVLDGNFKWQTTWGQDKAQLDKLPFAVEITLDHKQWGIIRRLIPVYGF